MKRWLSLLIVAIFAGCASAPKPMAETLPGFYAMTVGGFNESLSVELKKDFTYVMDHALFACVSGPNGETPITYSKEEGSWKFDGGLVILEPKARTDGFPDAPVFAPAAFRRLVPKKDGDTFYLVHPEFPTRCVLTKRLQKDALFDFGIK
jgi:hypothetical protein